MIHPSRRSFLRSLLALPIAAQLDVERLLWRPSPIITVPGIRRVTLQEIHGVTLRAIVPGIPDNFFKSSPLLEYLREHAVVEMDGREWVPVRGPWVLPFTT
jgi:hypothetical protein